MRSLARRCYRGNGVHRVTRVAVVAADETGCGYYRMRLPAGAVRQIRPEWRIDIHRPTDVSLAGDEGKLQAIKGIPDPLSIDLLVVQRVGTELQCLFVEWAIQHGIAVVLDSDDAMWCIERENSAWGGWNNNKVNWRWLDTASGLADLTTVTTKYLADRYGKHGRVEVLPNCVPAELREMLMPIREEFEATTTLGWAGFTATHPGDLLVCGDAVKRVVEDTGCFVRVVGDAAGAVRDWDLDTAQGVEPVPIGLPYYTALTTIDIGLVPLKDTKFNRGKSYLKALEFAAVGVPVIASPTPANRELAKTVPIVIAETPGEWYAFIADLVNNPAKREELAYASQEAVFTHHTYEGNAERWAQAWERAIVRRERMHA